jgi:hypothetical protein
MNDDRISRPRKSGEMSDMVHRIKHFQGDGSPSFRGADLAGASRTGPVEDQEQTEERNNDG